MTGPWAYVALLVLLGLIAALLVYVKPTLRMSLSAALWIPFIIYWSVAAKNPSVYQRLLELTHDHRPGIASRRLLR